MARISGTTLSCGCTNNLKPPPPAGQNIPLAGN